MKINKLLARSYSYGSVRDKNDIKYIVIHYTAGKGDTAKAEATYFAKNNTRSAGAHFFVDKTGEIYKSVNMNRIAWSVGGSIYSDVKITGGGQLYKKATNANSISIELCDLCSGNPSKQQYEAIIYLIKYIRKYCPNAKNVIRHFDVTGKHCPVTLMTDKKWNAFLKKIGEKQ